MGEVVMVVAIVLMLSSFPLSSSARTLVLNSNSTVTNEEEKQSVFIQECRCPGFRTPLCGKESIVVQKFPPPDSFGTGGRTILTVSNTCPLCSANQIILDYSSILPPNLLFPYCDVNDAKPIMPFHNWITAYQGSANAPITVLQANFTFLH